MAQKTGKTQFQTRLPPDVTKRVERLEEGTEAKESEIIRRLVQKGLYADSRAQRYADDARDIGKLLIGLGVGSFAVGLFVPGTRALGPVVLMLVFCAFGTAGLLLSDYLEPEGL